MGKTKQNIFIRFLKYFFPWKGDGIKESIRKTIFLIALIVLIVSSFYIIDYFLGLKKSDEKQNQFIKIFEQNSTQELINNLPQGAMPEFASLYNENQDTIGWINIPNTNVNYPVVLGPKDNPNNDYYLTRDFFQKKDKYGSIFLDERNKLTKDHMDDNTIIYGHSVKGGKMFYDLLKYKKLDFYKQSPVLTFNTLYEKSQWKIFAGFVSNADYNKGDVFEYINFINAKSDKEYLKYVEDIKARSFWLTDVDVFPSDKLLTLSTCSYEFNSARFVLVARKVREGEDPTVNVQNAVVNQNRLAPNLR